MKWIVTILIIYFAFIFSLVPSFGADRKVLYIASYHADKGEWTAGIKKGIESVLDSKEDIVLRAHNMDTRLTKEEEDKKRAALKAKEVIEEWQPDIVIISDDNAAKYLLEPYYRNVDLPFVFCGLNWDASVYGLPYKNTTGMVEVQLIQEILDHLQPYAKGKKIGTLRGDTLTNRKEQQHFEKHTGIPMLSSYVRDLKQWKQRYLELQSEVDILVLGSVRALDMQGVSIEDLGRFVLENTSIPSGAYDEFMKAVALVTLSTIPEEQGQWAAEQAVNILNGLSPADIPLVQNKKAKRILNMKLARQLDIRFPIELLQSSHLVSGANTRVLFVNSYHKGYKWSDDIEKGLFKALGINSEDESRLEYHNATLDVKIFRMNSKLQHEEEQIKRAALEAKQLIDTWRPDLVIACDDNAARYLIQPFYSGGSLPVVFCGVNYDAGVYGFPAENMTGMVEVENLEDTVSMLRTYARGDRIGYIGADDRSNRKSLKFHEDMLGMEYVDGSLVATFSEWQREFERLQSVVDILIILNPVGIKGWNGDEVETFLLENISIPTGAVGDSEVRFSLLGHVKIAEEQGWWAGKTALRILGGEIPQSIPVTKNTQATLYLNMGFANKLGIKFPVDLLERAIMLEPTVK